MQPNAWPDRCDGRGGFSPRLCDEEILEAAGEVRAALGWLSDALRQRDAAPMTLVTVPTLLRTVADCERAIGTAEEELLRNIQDAGEAADLIECRLR
ncbi:hypothetical protein [Gordonia phthalatica]|uniref:Uncharacterized protein n=1 Tax=Gordonia phthalatica TaxID=1136941 RepID=A0A0N9N6T0_9ACTN|nr:hypothetical protein [Gordonia phthalatica]ALG86291.1 hypothetical protein ACH46_19605 [Gordonia phthalatica]